MNVIGYFFTLFQDIDRTKIPEKHKWAGKKTCNVHKNRRRDVLPGRLCFLRVFKPNIEVIVVYFLQLKERE